MGSAAKIQPFEARAVITVCVWRLHCNWRVAGRVDGSPWTKGICMFRLHSQMQNVFHTTDDKYLHRWYIRTSRGTLVVTCGSSTKWARQKYFLQTLAAALSVHSCSVPWFWSRVISQGVAAENCLCSECSYRLRIAFPVPPCRFRTQSSSHHDTKSSTTHYHKDPW